MKKEKNAIFGSFNQCSHLMYKQQTNKKVTLFGGLFSFFVASCFSRKKNEIFRLDKKTSVSVSKDILWSFYQIGIKTCHFRFPGDFNLMFMKLLHKKGKDNNSQLCFRDTSQIIVFLIRMFHKKTEIRVVFPPEKEIWWCLYIMKERKERNQNTFILQKKQNIFLINLIISPVNKHAVFKKCLCANMWRIKKVKN